MKSQIALLGIGLVIASGVAYAELKPASDTPIAPIVSTPEPVASDSAAPAASPATSKSSTKVKTPAPKKSTAPKITKPTISGGGDDDDDDDDEDERDDERNEGREEDDD
jgi:hypothetical protein